MGAFFPLPLEKGAATGSFFPLPLEKGAATGSFSLSLWERVRVRASPICV